jgi:hypothetical protein
MKKPVVSTATVLLMLLVLQIPASAVSPDQLPLITKSDCIYIGSFKVPGGDSGGCNSGTGQHCFNYGGVFGYNPLKNSLYMKGHPWVGGVGEVSIPSIITPAGNTTAKVVQNIYDVADGKQVDPGETNGQGPADALVYNNRLIISGSTYYDADYTQTVTHGVSGFSFSVANDFQGWYRFDPTVVANPRSIGGYMTAIPGEWRAFFGGPALTGNCCLSIISASSSGPAATVFDPDDIGVKNPIPGKTLLFYPLDHQLAPGSTQNELFNLATKIQGIAFPSGSRSVLFFGYQGTGPYCYGIGSECGDQCDDSKGTHAYPYRHQVWAYDANDLLQVKSGAKQSWEVKPYAVWQLKDIDSGSCARLSGACFDPSTGWLYLTTDFGDNPVVHVYSISLPPDGVAVNKTGRKAKQPIVDISNRSASETTIVLRLSEPDACNVLGALYDIRGRRVADLAFSAQAPDRRQATWNNEDQAGGPISRGTYFLAIHARGMMLEKKIIHIR